MSRLDKLFGQTVNGRAGVGADAELVSLLNRIVADIDRLKRGAYQGPGTSFTGPLIIDDYRIEFIAGSMVATSISTGESARFSSSSPYQRVTIIGDEFGGFPPNTSSWGTSPYGAAGNRWIDILFNTYRSTTLIDGTYKNATASTLVTAPRTSAVRSDLLILCVGAADTKVAPGTGLAAFEDSMSRLLDSYQASVQLVIFPWAWQASSGVATQYHADYLNAAKRAANVNAARFINLNELTVTSAFLASPSSSTYSVPSLDGNQAIFAEIQQVLNA